MQRTDIPVNLALLQVTPERVRAIRPVTALDIFEGASDNFHEHGLFSVGIFGRVGSEERDTRFSYIDIKVEIFHPFMFKQLSTLKGLYGGILASRAYAIWDDKIKDFVASDVIHGDTGYHFFMRHWRDINLKGTGSDIRDLRIQMIEQFKDQATLTKVLVLPAGMRDIEVMEGGRKKQGEVNEFYRSILSVSNTISSTGPTDSPVLDQSRYSLQLSFNKVYDYFHGLLEGKNGFMQAKWGSRRVFNGTRNVMTAMDTAMPVLGAGNAPNVNNTVLGLYQVMKGVLPQSKFLVLNGWMGTLFNKEAGTAWLINRTTLKRELVRVDAAAIDLWTTTSGIERVINRALEFHNRLRPVLINNYYVGLVYTSDDLTKWPTPVFKVFGDIDDLPVEQGLKRRDVRPITLYELLYIAGYAKWNTFPCYITRYPVTGIGSIYPSRTYVKTTTQGTMRTELGDDWQPMAGAQHIALEYPNIKLKSFVDSMMPHPSRIKDMQADFDGDTGSVNHLYTEDAINETNKHLDTIEAYLSPRGGFKNSCMVETVERVLRNFTA